MAEKKKKELRKWKGTFGRFVRKLWDFADSDGVLRDVVIKDCEIRNIPKDSLVFYNGRGSSGLFKILDKAKYVIVDYFKGGEVFFFKFKCERVVVERNHFIAKGYNANQND